MSLLKIKQEIERLGGIYVPKGVAFPVLDAEEIVFLESKVGKDFPKNYRDFLSVFAGCSFNNSVYFKPQNNTAEYVHPEGSGYMNPVFQGSDIAYFYGSDRGVHHMSWAFSTYWDRIPDFCLPIASDGFGNQIILSLQEGSYGQIYWWDHHNEWDAEDYEEENDGEPMPERVKWQNMYLIASDFCGLFENLYVKEDE